MLYTGKRKWQKLSIEDIEEKIEGYEEIELGYDLVDTNEFTKQQLLEDNLITSKAMLIEKSQNKEELYQNIEDIISCKNKMEDFEYAQLEKIVKYELMGTEDREIISKFIEKIKNREESENIMMNAARIINREIRKQRREGREEGREEGIKEGREEGHQAGIKEGREEERELGIRRLIEDNLEEKKTKEIIIQKLIRWFSMDEQTAQLYLDKYADSENEKEEIYGKI